MFVKVTHDILIFKKGMRMKKLLLLLSLATFNSTQTKLDEFITRIVEEKRAVEQKTSLPSIACFFDEALEELKEIEATLIAYLENADDVIIQTSTIAKKVNDFSEIMQKLCGGKRLVINYKLKKITSQRLPLFEKTKRKLERLHKKYRRKKKLSMPEIITAFELLIKEMTTIKTILLSIVVRAQASDEQLCNILVSNVHITDRLDSLLEDPCDPLPYRL